MRCLRIVCVIFCLTFAATAQSRHIDAKQSKFLIHVDKAGFFSALGHKHDVEARIASGTLDEKAQSIEFTVDAAAMTVLDPDTKADERATVQKNMHEQVLESAKYPQIKFVSSSSKSDKIGHWTVKGDLTLHGVTKPVTVDVTEPTTELATPELPAERHFTGSATLKQTDFGITPIKIGGGAVRVKDELKIEFEIVAVK